MKYKRGSIVEVFCYQSWRCARIVSGRGHKYTVSFDVYPGFTNRDDIEQISMKSIRPCPPQLEVLKCWVPGDVAEVFHNLSWKMAIVLKVFGWDQFIVRLVGSSQEFEVSKSEMRVRQSYLNGEWIVIGEVPSDRKDANCPETRKRPSPFRYSLDKTNKKRARKTFENEFSECESSSGSCSIYSYKLYETNGGPGFVEHRECDAESVCQSVIEESQSQSQSQEIDESAEAMADEIHRLESRAYRYTMVALHASGPLTWEKESMGQSTGLACTPCFCISKLMSGKRS